MGGGSINTSSRSCVKQEKRFFSISLLACSGNAPLGRIRDVPVGRLRGIFMERSCWSYCCVGTNNLCGHMGRRTCCEVLTHFHQWPRCSSSLVSLHFSGKAVECWLHYLVYLVLLSFPFLSHSSKMGVSEPCG